jgi:hypothetical protein
LKIYTYVPVSNACQDVVDTLDERLSACGYLSQSWFTWQVWKKKGFPKQLGNVIFVQLDSVKARRLWVIPEPGKDGLSR